MLKALVNNLKKERKRKSISKDIKLHLNSTLMKPMEESKVLISWTSVFFRGFDVFKSQLVPRSFATFLYMLPARSALVEKCTILTWIGYSWKNRILRVTEELKCFFMGISDAIYKQISILILRLFKNFSSKSESSKTIIYKMEI